MSTALEIQLILAQEIIFLQTLGPIFVSHGVVALMPADFLSDKKLFPDIA